MHNKVMAGAVLSVLLLTSFIVSPAQLAHAAEVGFTSVSTIPSTGTVNPGETVLVRLIHPEVADFAVNTAQACTINGKDVTSTFQSFGDHEYQLEYAVASGDANVAAGQLAISCSFKNEGEVTAVASAFTNGNTLAIAGTTGDTTGGDTTGGDTTNNNTNNNTNANTNTNTNTNSTSNGTLTGDVNGGTNSNGTLAVTSVDQVRNVATADGTIENGWRWVFHVTVPTNEPTVALKFGNWTHTNGVNAISPVNNMRFFSTQAASAAPVTITAANDYSGTITLTGDQDSATPGRQVEIVVEMGVPVGSTNGAYTTTYGIKSSAN